MVSLKIALTLCCVALILSLVSVGYCEDDEVESAIKNGYFNGRLVDDALKYKSGSSVPESLAYYCMGLFDALNTSGYGKQLEDLYGEGTKKIEIIETICAYYQNNPNKRNRKILDVLLSGAT